MNDRHPSGTATPPAPATDADYARYDYASYEGQSAQHGGYTGYDGYSADTLSTGSYATGSYTSPGFETDPLFGDLPGNSYDSGQWSGLGAAAGGDATGTYQHQTVATQETLNYDPYAAQHHAAYETGSYDTTGVWASAGYDQLAAHIPTQATSPDATGTGQWDSGEWAVDGQTSQTGQWETHANQAYDQQAFAQHDLGQSDFGQSDFGQSDFGQSDFGQSDFGQSDFGQHDFGQPPLDTQAFSTGAFGGQSFDTGAYDATAWNSDGGSTAYESLNPAPEPEPVSELAPEPGQESYEQPTAAFEQVSYEQYEQHDSPEAEFAPEDGLRGHERDHGGEHHDRDLHLDEATSEEKAAEPLVSTVSSSARVPRARSRRRSPAKRSALLTVAVPSACVMGVAGIAAASVSNLGGDDDSTTTAAPDTSSVKPSVANNKLDTQLENLSADAGDFADRASRTQERIDLKAQQEAERKRAAEEAARKERLRPKFALPVAQHGLSAYYGQSGINWMSVHTGIDFPVSYGTPVMAATDGTVRVEWNPAYGNMAIVTAKDGTETWYCHLSSHTISSGTVKAGDVIAYSGNSGNSTGPHLHFEVRPGGGAAIDPLPWLRSHGIDPA
ncbi:peptidoglycan DD-metalloendopeptidase family protein [Streptomyces sp. PSKA28]|uniref:Peptidoglycan DD-metalloendopeptidase family protein n=1 Tax=Streptomyces himalayensis subsp. himalayensis TaxID=2756131 RepID=A0A7W0IAL0_9ACTN|nr:peptidoglycan DD-metalloendopeptidase family protein [Streptomyces himalayensis]MBA2948214.1 peptidoglycan DD-metalloendopeptidase family protein [Streptomyces himalayensis subsp. himalayensis]